MLSELGRWRLAGPPVIFCSVRLGKAVEEAGNLWRLVKAWASLQVEFSECRVSLD